MKLASFRTSNGTNSYGIVTDAGVIDAGKRLSSYPTLKALLAAGKLGELQKLAGEAAEGITRVMYVNNYTIAGPSTPASRANRTFASGSARLSARGLVCGRLAGTTMTSKWVSSGSAATARCINMSSSSRISLMSSSAVG